MQLEMPNSSKPSARRKGPKRPTYGPLAVAWMEANLVHGEGDSFGEPFRCTDDQRQFLDRLLIYDAKTKRLLVREALLGRAKGWGKTEFVAAIVLFFLAGPLAPVAPNIPIAAASFEQADLLFGACRTMATEGALKPYVDAFDTEILLKSAPGRAFRIAAAAGTNDGGKPTLFAADELHEWTGTTKERVFLIITNSIAKRRDGLVLVISTAGSDESDLLRGLYDRGKAIEAGVIDDESILMDWAEGDPDIDPLDGPDARAALARQANPHIDQFGTLEFVERRFHAIPLHEWLRYFANRWVSATRESWLPSGAWPACRGDATLIPGAPTWVGVDMALKHDSIAVVAVQKHAGRYRTQARIWFPNESTIDVAAVENHLRELHALYTLVEVPYDPAFFVRSAQVLQDDGLPMVEFNQSAARMVPACQTAYELICTGQVVHDGDPVFADQVESAVPRETDGGWRISKGKSKRKIDASIGLVMALSRAATTSPVRKLARLISF